MCGARARGCCVVCCEGRAQSRIRNSDTPTNAVHKTYPKDSIRVSCAKLPLRQESLGRKRDAHISWVLLCCGPPWCASSRTSAPASHSHAPFVEYQGLRPAASHPLTKSPQTLPSRFLDQTLPLQAFNTRRSGGARPGEIHASSPHPHTASA